MFEYQIDDHISLRILSIRDADALFCLIDANREYLRQWLPWVDVNTSPEDSSRFIQSALEQFAKQQSPTCIILWQEKIIGNIGYHPINWDNKSGSLGYWLAKAYTEKGIITKACKVFIDYGFTTLKLNKVIISAAEDNHKSRAVPERLGFKKEGITRDAEWLYDHFVNHVNYSLLQREWEAWA